ncbi:MAG: SH3 domain-containing protein [Bacteroidota bacterium]
MSILIKNTALILFNLFFLNTSFYLSSEFKEDSVKESEICIDVAEGLNLRKHARLSAGRIGIIPENERVLQIGEKGELMHLDCETGHWIKVSYQGVKGYIFLYK